MTPQSQLDQGRVLVDTVRHQLMSGMISEEEARQELTNASHFSIPRENNEDTHHRGGSVHLCPWHTCEATRHN